MCVCVKERERKRGVDGSVKDTRVAGSAMVCESECENENAENYYVHAHTHFLSLIANMHTKLTLDFFVCMLYFYNKPTSASHLIFLRDIF